MKHVTMTLVLLFLLLPGLTVVAETGEEIMQHVLDNQKVSSSAMDIRMTLIAPNGSESGRRIQTLVLDNDDISATITVFLEPASVRNTRFLTIDNQGRADDQWIYLPSLRRVRRIAATERDSSFMGSDFSYSDISFSQSSIEDNRHTLLRNETLDGRQCAVVESIPKSDNTGGYARQVSWIDRATWLPLRVEFFSEGSTTREKVLKAGDLRQVDGRWLTGTLTMTTVSSGHRTVLSIDQVRYDIPLDPGYFTTTFLETGRPR